MGNIVESALLQLEEPQTDRKHEEYVEVIDLDSKNWREKVQKFKEIWYAKHSAGDSDISKEEVQVLLKQELNRKKSHVKLRTTEKAGQVSDEHLCVRKISTNQKNDSQCQVKDEKLRIDEEEKHIQQRQELFERTAKSKERIECFRKKYKLNERDFGKRELSVGLIDKKKDKKERDQAKKLRHQLRVKYQLPVDLGCQRLNQ